MAKPTVDVLAATKGIEVTVASRTLSKAKELAGSVAKAISLDVKDEKALDAAVEKHDLVISLIPYTLHSIVIKSAIRKKKHVVTTSYISPAMKELEEEVKKAGIVVFNEIGLDPGIDHLYAVKTIDEVHKAKGKITSFLSYCGGLPSPEFSDNPLGYKFSWSPRGVLLALRNSARYWKNGKIEEIASENLMDSAKPYFIFPGFALVGYPNRDSTGYKERYDISEAETVIRGTLRFQGFPEFAKVLVDVGFLSDEPVDYLSPDEKPLPWNEALAKLLNSSSSSEKDLIWAISSKTKFKSTSEKNRIIAGFKFLGLFSDDPITPRGNPLDTLCAVLEQKMHFGEGERDLVILQHKFKIEWADKTTETRTSTLVEYGVPGGYSAMARLVGIPCAVTVRQILNGTIDEPGIHAPVTPKFAYSIMDELREEFGITLIEKSIPI